MMMTLAEEATTLELPSTTTSAPAAGARTYLDPLDDDRPDDEVVVTTRRAICRIALVATEAGGRFEREAVPHDPMSWMLAPRALFGGVSAVEACLDRDDCLRGVLIHGLSLGLDADPEFVDGLATDDGDAAVIDPGSGGWRSNVLPFARSVPDGLRLFTATVVSNDGFETVQAFHASLATEEAEVAGRLYCRMGAAAAEARIVDGFDPAEPLVAALVSDAICDTLSIIASDPASPIAAGLDLNIEQRFLG
ncbi:hypothetical protein QH494_03675 [Sphingomonas sp. AR_OL41]|uniref:hypothetical protein n=1 Tax=Sphingomonas sp. AR_OL41 TaxID=3042729 RepID=UPI0024808D02|nr:hypothetical protein [Sphingomonas sp. AR_OL41]MDH7971269.1 hypothetical protein [Sphingomonas sp. AR_OL41]